MQEAFVIRARPRLLQDAVKCIDCLEHGSDNVSMVHNVVSAPSPPLRLTIDCGSNEQISTSFGGTKLRPPDIFKSSSPFDVDSFCSLIHSFIPKAVKDGKFILIEPDSDQMGFSNNQVPIAVAPPKGFIPKLGLNRLKVPKLSVPKIYVPKLKTSVDKSFMAPRIGSSMKFPGLRTAEEESSAERMEKFKKGVKKMLHFVKVLGQIDQYLSERTRIVVDKLAKTFAE